MKIAHNVFNTFLYTGLVDFEGQAVDVSNLNFKSQVRDESGELVADLTVSKMQGNQIQISHDSSSWPVNQVLKWDIAIEQNNERISSEIVWIDTKQGATQ